MPVIHIPRRHYTQPQGRVEVSSDWVELVDRVILPGRKDLHDRFGVYNNYSIDYPVTDAGPAQSFNKTQNRLLLRDSSSLNTMPFSVLALVRPSGTGNRVVFSGADRSRDDGYYTVRVETDGKVSATHRNPSVAAALTANAVAAGQWNVIGGIWRAIANRAAFCNGVVGAANTTSQAAVTCTAEAVGTLWRANGFVDYFEGDIALVVEFRHALSDGEVRALSADPWQIFRAEPRRIYSFPSGEIVIPTLSALTTTHITSSGARHTLTLSGL